MGRLLDQMGAPFKRPEWSALSLMEAPHYVTQAHDAYIEAGAEVITTNSYALVPFHIGQERFEKEGRALMKLSAQLARQSADNAPHKVRVAGSIPPAFGSYRPDLYIEEKADEIYLPLIEEQAPYVDVWLAETVASIQEAKKITSLLKERDKPLWMSFTVRDREGNDVAPQLRSQETIEDLIHTIKDLKIDALLFNCSQIEEMSAVLEIIKSSKLDIPYGVYANAFVPVKEDVKANSDNTSIREDTTPEVYLSQAEHWKNLGATMIGGCCGIGPEHIKALSTLNR